LNYDVLILAAGFSQRMGDITKTLPKSLVIINETNLLFNIISELQKIKINSINVVTGYKRTILEKTLVNEFRNMNFSFIRTNLYKKTGHTYSLLKGLKFIQKKNSNGCLIIHADTCICNNFFIKNFTPSHNSLLLLEKIPNFIRPEEKFFFNNFNKFNQSISKNYSDESIGIISGIMYFNIDSINKYCLWSKDNYFKDNFLKKNWEYYVNWLLEKKLISFKWKLLKNNSTLNVNYPDDFLKASKIMKLNREK